MHLCYVYRQHHEVPETKGMLQDYFLHNTEDTCVDVKGWGLEFTKYHRDIWGEMKGEENEKEHNS